LLEFLKSALKRTEVWGVLNLQQAMTPSPTKANPQFK